MSVAYEYDEEAKYLLTRFWGVVTDADVERQARAVAEDERIGPGTKELVDLSGVQDVEASSQSLRSIVFYDLTHSEKFRGHKTAIFAPEDLPFGMSRIYEALSEVSDAPSEVRVFRTIEEAREWLDEEADN